MDRAAKVTLFRALHQGPRLLLLANAWDVASARIFESAGCLAIGTSSAAIANSLGYPDGQRISRDEMLDVVRRIAKAVSIPVSADLENGYDDVIATAHAAVEAGAVGLNLEDVNPADEASLVDLATQVRLVEKMRAETDLVINARTDVYLAGIGDAATLLERTVERLRAYRDAGADCLFAPGVRDAGTICRLVHALNGPLNILATAGAPTIGEMEQMGVRRVSIGSGPMRAVMGLTQRIARELLDRGSFSSMTEGAMPYADANRLFE